MAQHLIAISLLPVVPGARQITLIAGRPTCVKTCNKCDRSATQHQLFNKERFLYAGDYVKGHDGHGHVKGHFKQSTPDAAVSKTLHSQT